MPSHGSAGRLLLQTRRFICRLIGCPVKIFAERFDPSIVQRFGRWTERLEGIVHHIGLALCDQPGHRTAERLVLPGSRDTLLRVVCLGVANKAMADYMRYAAEFGMTPSSRTRITASTGEGEDDDALARFFN